MSTTTGRRGEEGRVLSFRNRSFLLLGLIYRLLYRLPVVGDSVVRGISRTIGVVAYRSPYGIKSCVSMDAFREELQRLAAMADLPVEITGHDEDRLDLVVNWCPYGFSRPEHKGACEAAMDMDRIMYRYCGLELVIDESVLDGLPTCKVSIHRMRQAFVPGGHRSTRARGARDAGERE